VAGKDDKIVIRIDAELKEKFTKYVENKGNTVSNYIRQMIIEELEGYDYQLNKYNMSIKEQVSEIINPEIDIYKKVDNMNKRMKELEILVMEGFNKDK